MSIPKFIKNIGRFFYHSQHWYEGDYKVQAIRICHIRLKPKRSRDYTALLMRLDTLYGRIESLQQDIASLQEATANVPKLLLTQNEYISKSFSVSNLHSKVFPKYKNINQGKTVVLIATGPSLQHFIPMEGAVYVGVNRAFEYSKVKFDYLFMQDFSGKSKNYIEQFVNYDAIKFLGHLAHHLIPQCTIPEKYGSYPGVERYYEADPKEKITFTYDLSTNPLGDAYSVVFPAMQFILWTNPKTIYLVGCDSNNRGYHDEKKATNCLMVSDVIEGWKRMKEFAAAYYPDTEIISVNPVGLKGLFTDMGTEH